jgi:hypothetical protein
MTLDDAIAALYVREINCGVETFWDGGIKVWIGDTTCRSAPYFASATQSISMSNGPNHPAVQMKMRAGLYAAKYSA